MAKRSLEQPSPYLFQKESSSIFTALPKKIAKIAEHGLSCMSENYRYALNSRYYDLLVIKPQEQHIRGEALYTLQQEIVKDIGRRSSGIERKTCEAEQFEARVKNYILKAKSYTPNDPHDRDFVTDAHRILERWAKATLVLALREAALLRLEEDNPSSRYLWEYAQTMYSDMGKYLRDERLLNLRDALGKALLCQNTESLELVDQMTEFIHAPLLSYNWRNRPIL